MAQGKENRLAEKMIDEFTSSRFSPTVFAEHIRHLPPLEQQKFMDVMTSVFALMSDDYLLGHYDKRNHRSAYLAHQFTLQVGFAEVLNFD